MEAQKRNGNYPPHLQSSQSRPPRGVVAYTRHGQIWRTLLILLVVVIVMVGGGILAYLLMRPGVVVVEATIGPAVEAFYATGTVQPQREFPIKTSIAGIVTEVKVDKGDRVTKGQVLATVSDPALDYAVHKAQADLEEKKAQADPATSPSLAELDARISAQKVLLEIATRERDRMISLIEKNAASQSDLDRTMERFQEVEGNLEALKSQRQSKALSLQRELSVARSALETAQWNQHLQTVVSPINGIVLDRPVSHGTRVAANDHLMQIADLSPSNLVMRAQVDEEDHTQLRENQLVQMSLYSFPDQSFEGRVEKIYDRADPDRRTFEVDIRFTPLQDRLAPGMTGELAFIIRSKADALTVPAQALQNGTLWTVRNGRVYPARVTVGLKSVQRVEITEGLQAGQLVVISQADDLSEGKLVRLTHEKMDQPAQSQEPSEASASLPQP